MMQRFDCGATISRAVVRDGLVYFSGHVAAGKQPTMKEQATALLARYDGLLKEYGSDRGHIVSATIYVTDMKLKPDFNEIWNAWLPPQSAPARVCVECGLDEGYFVEVSMIAEIVDETKEGMR
jgi:enamine deaminase RidA (YjgF/YER057c/UK114 family)